MKYQDLLFAHGAYYKFEPRAKFYDEYLREKDASKWLSPELPGGEIDELFRFITRWDFHFSGEKIKFKEVYREIYPFVNSLKDESFYSIDLSKEKNVSAIKSVFNPIALCNYVGRHESTDASKIIHTMNPNLFIMWDRSIRKGILGKENKQYCDDYIIFLQKMKDELLELISSCREKSDFDDMESIRTLEELGGGKTLAKLIDQYNYMTFTMPTEYAVYRQDIHPGVMEKFQNMLLHETIDLWKRQLFTDRYSSKGQLRHYLGLLDEAKKRGFISPKEWRDYRSRWDRNLDDRDYLILYFERILDIM